MTLILYYNENGFVQISVYFHQIRIQRRKGLQWTSIKCQIFVQRPERGDCRRDGCGYNVVGRHRRLSTKLLHKFSFKFFSTRAQFEFFINVSLRPTCRCDEIMQMNVNGTYQRLKPAYIIIYIHVYLILTYLITCAPEKYPKTSSC